MPSGGSELIAPEHKRPYNLDQKAPLREVLIVALHAPLGQAEPGALPLESRGHCSPLPFAAAV